MRRKTVWIKIRAASLTRLRSRIAHWKEESRLWKSDALGKVEYAEQFAITCQKQAEKLAFEKRKLKNSLDNMGEKLQQITSDGAWTDKEAINHVISILQSYLNDIRSNDRKACKRKR
jgi:molecular chaperone DnaK (HSP70)